MMGYRSRGFAFLRIIISCTRAQIEDSSRRASAWTERADIVSQNSELSHVRSQPNPSVVARLTPWGHLQPLPCSLSHGRCSNVETLALSEPMSSCALSTCHEAALHMVAVACGRVANRQQPPPICSWCTSSVSPSCISSCARSQHVVARTDSGQGRTDALRVVRRVDAGAVEEEAHAGG